MALDGPRSPARLRDVWHRARVRSERPATQGAASSVGERLRPVSDCLDLTEETTVNCSVLLTLRLSRGVLVYDPA
jgi:hypothetical protein